MYICDPAEVWHQSTSYGVTVHAFLFLELHPLTEHNVPARDETKKFILAKHLL